MSSTTCDVPALLDWASKAGIIFSPEVEVRPTVSRGLGVFANTSLEPGNYLLRVPAYMLLTPEAAARGPTIGPLQPVRAAIRALVNTGLELRLTDELALMMLLLRREHHALQRDEQGAFWSPYFDCLPQSFDCTLAWSKPEMRELQSSRVGEWTRRRNATATATLQRVKQAWDARGASQPPSREEWEWGLCAVWSRSFGVPIQGGGGKPAPALAPLTGMFNGAAYPGLIAANLARLELLKSGHEPDERGYLEPRELLASLDEAEIESNVQAGFDPATNTFLVQAAAAVPEGKELLLLYGDGKGAAELSMDYGFAHSVVAGVAMLDATVVLVRTADLLEHWRTASGGTFPRDAVEAAQARLREGGVADEHPLSLDMRRAPSWPALLGAARALCESCDHDGHTHLLRSFGEALLREYGTTARDDAHQLSAGVGTEGLPLDGRGRTAIAVRLAEKRVLQHFVRGCGEWEAPPPAGPEPRVGGRDEAPVVQPEDEL